MFSKLSATILPLVRQAESTDTHQYIRQHERDKDRRRNSDSRPRDDEADGDETSVSLDALLLFLENMVVRPQRNETKPSINADRKSAPSATQQRHTSPSLYATHAYAHAAKTSPSPVTEPHHNPDTTGTQELSPPIAESDQNPLIDEIIKELHGLKKMGVTELHLDKGETFASSLFNAIERAKSSASI
jgi:hypothetical protein